ncbi:30S ribosomal protein S19e [Halorhabdus amylolytica]|uniref:30S ribosomal protein S19e n=1 Tax=Halorhabdus amylolytica TaxID=2559573 RepID=UPI0010AA37C3|nr:30S ribosomal protein S19e [Halorhabdus amylolytica]
MATLYDVPPEDLVDALADELADEDAIEAPEWLTFAKTGVGKELAPEQEDFWETRAASLLRKVAVDGPIGVGSLATAYGDTTDGSNRYRVSPPKQADGSRNIIRTALQQLESVGYVQTAEGEGRRITPDGRALLDEIATDVLEDLDDPELERYA